MSSYSLYNGQWQTCGCAGTKKEPAPLPENTKAVMIRVAQKMIGPVTGIEYDILPHLVSIDIDVRDADVWLRQNIASPQTTGKGRLTRTGVVHAAKQT